MKSAAHFALWIKSTKYLSFISQGRQQEIKCLVKSKRNCSLWDGFYVLSSHHYLSPPSSHRRSSAMHVHAGVCVCLHYGRVSHPRKADGRCATQLGNFPPKTVGLLPVHLLRLNQPQSATYFLKCLQSWLTVRVTLSVCVFDVWMPLSVFLLSHYVTVFKCFSPSVSYCSKAFSWSHRRSDPVFTDCF